MWSPAWGAHPADRAGPAFSASACGSSSCSRPTGLRQFCPHTCHTGRCHPKGPTQDPRPRSSQLKTTHSSDQEPGSLRLGENTAAQVTPGRAAVVRWGLRNSRHTGVVVSRFAWLETSKSRRSHKKLEAMEENHIKKLEQKK